jgi:hypothetical protein
VCRESLDALTADVQGQTTSANTQLVALFDGLFAVVTDTGFSGSGAKKMQNFLQDGPLAAVFYTVKASRILMRLCAWSLPVSMMLMAPQMQ